MEPKKVILDNIVRSSSTWSATSDNNTVSWLRHSVDIASGETEPICEGCESTIEDTDWYWLCLDGSHTYCEDCILESSPGRDCPECGDDLFFCDDGESDDYEKKIYSCHNQVCPTDFVTVERYKQP